MSWIPSYKKPQSAPEPPTIVQWSTGTDEEIVAMVQAHYDGLLDLHDYWAVGDTRTVSLSEMSGTGVGTRQLAQDVTFVLSNVGDKILADGITECAFQIDQVHSLLAADIMNSTRTNAGGWKDSARRTWCNEIYYNAIPSTLRPIFKQFINQTGLGGGSTSGVEDTTDYFALRAEIEVTGSNQFYSVSGEGSWVTWYKTTPNRMKRQGDNIQYWWLRSPTIGDSQSFDYIDNDGNCSYYSYAYYGNGIAPFGVI